MFARTKIFTSRAKADEFIVKYLLPLGLFIQMSGIIWLGRGGSISQTYVWLSFPALVSVLLNWRAWPKLKDNAMVILLAILFSWAALSVTWGTTDKDSIDVIKRSLHIALYLYAIYRICEQPERFEKIILAASGVVAISAVIAFYHTFVVDGAGFTYRAVRLSTMGLDSFPNHGNFLNPIPAGIYYGFFATSLYVYLISREQTWQSAIYAAICLSLISTYLLFTWSRGPILATLAATGFATLVIRNWKSNVCLVGGLIAGITTLWVFQDLIFSEQVLSSNFSNRTGLWKQTLVAVSQDLKTLLLGFGFDPGLKIMLAADDPLVVSGRIKYFLHTHSVPLQVVYNYGLIGFSFFLGILILSARHVLEGSWRKHWYLPAALGIFGFAAMLTDINAIINRPSQFWFAVWVPVALALSQRAALIKLKTACSKK